VSDIKGGYSVDYPIPTRVYKDGILIMQQPNAGGPPPPPLVSTELEYATFIINV
jgi:hypothetical protein